MRCFPREINYIWRHGNLSFATDELTPAHARPEVRRYIRRRFERFQHKNGGKRVIEKTCANTLRVNFVHAVFPDAFIIHIVRDGRSVAESARRCWTAKPKLGYLLEKLRWVPFSDIPYYGFRYLKFQLGRIGSAHNAQSSWGPRFAGLDELVNEKSLIEVAALQWQRCLRAASHSLSKLPSNQVHTLRYEDLVMDPIPTVAEVFDKVGADLTKECRNSVAQVVKRDNVSKWRAVLAKDEIKKVESLISEDLRLFGYEV